MREAIAILIGAVLIMLMIRYGDAVRANFPETRRATHITAPFQDLAETYDWFTPSLKDIRMLRIEENKDLMPILEKRRKRQ